MEFETLPRKELQAFAKQHGIKANLSTVAIIDALRVLFPKSEETQAEETAEANNTSKATEIVKEEEVMVEVTVAPRKSILFQPEIQFEESIKAVPEVPKASTGPFNSTKASSSTNFEVGQSVQFSVEGVLMTGIIKKVNKVTCRVTLPDGDEMLIKSSELAVFEKMEESVVEPEDVKMEEEVPVIAEPSMESSDTNENTLNDERETNTEENTTSDNQSAPLCNEMEEEPQGTNPAAEKTDEEILQEVDRVLDESMIGYDQMDVGDSDEEQTVVQEEDNTIIFDNDDEDEEGEYEQNDDSFILPNMDSLIGGETPTRNSLSARKSRHSMIIKSPLDRLSFSARKLSHSARKSLPQATNNTENSTITNTLKKTFSTTPLRAKPTIVPRTNAAQLKRLEAAKQKNQQPSANDSISHAAKKKTPLPIASVGIIRNTTTLSEAHSKPSVKFEIGAEEKTQCKVNAKIAARKATPNFKALHQKQFENSKSIASIVNRDNSIAKKMDAAFVAAQNGQLSSMSNQPKSSSKPNTVNNNSRNTPSTIKPMKPVASKKPTNLETKMTSFVQDKENNQPTATNASTTPSFLKGSQFPANKMRVNAKDASAVKTTAGKQDVRRQSFNKSNDVSRKNAISQKRTENAFSFVL
eukprot:gene9387-10193_t